MSKEMREQINKVKNFKQFLNESKADKMADANAETIGAIRRYSDERWRLFSQAVESAINDEDLEQRLKLIGFYDSTINVAKELFNRVG